MGQNKSLVGHHNAYHLYQMKQHWRAKLLTVVKIRGEPVVFKNIYFIFFKLLQKSIVVHCIKCYPYIRSMKIKPIYFPFSVLRYKSLVFFIRQVTTKCKDLKLG